MLLAHKHPDFDLGLEIMASLTVRPTPLRSLKADFNEPSVASLKKHIRVAARRFRVDYSINISRNKGPTVKLDEPLPLVLVRMCEQYLNKVYP